MGLGIQALVSFSSNVSANIDERGVLSLLQYIGVLYIIIILFADLYFNTGAAGQLLWAYGPGRVDVPHRDGRVELHHQVFLANGQQCLQYDNFCEHMAQMLMFPTGMVVLNSTRRSFWL